MGVCTTARPVKLAAAIVWCFLMIGIPATARAQSFDLTPFGGWRFGGAFADLQNGTDIDLDNAVSYGLILSIPWRAEHRSRLELVWSRQPTNLGLAGFEDASFDLDLDYLHIGGVVPFSTPNEKLETLLTGGLGATLMWPGLAGANSEVRFSMSLGVGLLYHFSERVGLRLEARGWYTFTEAGGGIFCAGGCVVAFSGSGFGQGELITGLQLSF